MPLYSRTLTGVRHRKKGRSRGRPRPFYSVFDADTLAQKQGWRAAGGTHCNISAEWSQLQPAAGALDSTAVTALQTQFAEAATAGLRVTFSFSTHYTPDFARAGAPRFRNQAATDWAPASNVAGDNVIDAVFSATARTYIADFMTRVWAALTASQRAMIDQIRIGGGPYGELHYPTVSTGPDWWSFSAPAQTGTGLATGQTVCPLPGHLPWGWTTGGLLSTNAYSIETSAADWVAANAGTTVTRNASPTGGAQVGTAVLNVVRNDSTSLAQARTATASRIAVTPGSVYTARCWGRNPTSGRNGFLGIEWYNSGGTLLSTSASTSRALSSSEWRPVEVTGTAPATAATAGLIYGLAPAEATSSQVFYGDGFNFIAGTNPDLTFAAWHVAALTNYMVWQVDTVRGLGYGGACHVLHPSFGLRSNWTATDFGWREQMAEGCDWEPQLAAYSRGVYPQNTWGDQSDVVSPPVLDSDKATWRKLLELAQAAGVAAWASCENTGDDDTGVPDEDDDINAMGRMFGTDGALESGYRGVTWLSYDTLVTSSTLDDIGVLMQGDPRALRAVQTIGAYKPVADGTVAATAGWLNDPSITMTTINANVSLNSASALLENSIVNGLVSVTAANVIIRNCIIRGPASQPVAADSALITATSANVSNLLIEDTTVEFVNAQQEYDGIRGHDFTASRVHVRWCTDGFGVFHPTNGAAAGNVSILGCVVEELAKFYPDLSHVDGTHNDCIQIQQGNGNIVIRGNVLSAALGTAEGNTVPAGTNVLTGGGQYSPVCTQGTAVLLVNEANGITGAITQGITFEDNWCYGGQIAVNITDSNIEAGRNIGTFQRNQFDHAQYLDVAQQGTNTTQTIRINNSLTATIANNTYEDNGVAVQVRRP
jgi:hypothetical protein